MIDFFYIYNSRDQQESIIYRQHHEYNDKKRKTGNIMKIKHDDKQTTT